MRTYPMNSPASLPEKRKTRSLTFELVEQLSAEIQTGVLISGQKLPTEAAIMAGADDVQSTGEQWEITCAAGNFATVRDELATTIGDALEANLTYVPTQMQAINNLETAQTILKLVDALEADDDVQTVTTNLDLPEDLAAKLA